MYEKLFEVLGNSHFEAYIGGPVAGVLAGLVFAGFGKSPEGQQSLVTPKILHVQFTPPPQRPAQQRPTPNDGSGLLLVAAISLVLVFLFAAYLPTIAFGLYVLIATVAMFSLASCVFATISGQLNTSAWWLHIICPILISLGALNVAFIVERSISPEVVAYAQSLLENQRITLSTILNGAVTFFKQINSTYMQWMAFQMGAFVLAAAAALSAFLQCVHLIALSNVRSSDSAMWRWLAEKTYRFSTPRSPLSAAVLLCVAWLLASGHAYTFFSQ